MPILHTRKINHDAPVFFMEAPSCEGRKILLREEIQLLKQQLDSMSKWLEFAEEINAKRQKNKLQRGMNKTSSGSHQQDAVKVNRSKLKSVKGEERKFKKGLLSAASDDSPPDRAKKVKTLVGNAISRGKLQQLKGKSM